MSLPSSQPLPRIAPIRAVDLICLRQTFGLSTAPKHAQRFARQKQGKVVYLIAWLGNEPVGHALLNWAGSTDVAVSSHLCEPCPDIEDLWVVQGQRNRGIGSQILQEAEERVVEQGVARVGLSVGVDNFAARRLYERRGYRDAGFDAYWEQGTYIDAAGQRQQWEELCLYLIKPLA